MPRDFECSQVSAARGEPMFATGSLVRGWLLVEVRGAWGPDAVHDSALGEFVPAHWKEQLKQRGVRAICVRSHLRPEAGEVRLFTCAARRPGDTAARVWWRDVSSLADVADATAEVSSDRDPGDAWQPLHHPLLLVCTNGRHDACCADYGRPLARAIRASRWGRHLWECSHVGGDRFAGNLVVLPRSLYFGRVTPEAAVPLLSALEAGRIDLDHFRGRTSYSLAEQAVEHFVRRELDVAGVDDVVVGERAADGAFQVRLADGTVQVRIRRRMQSVAEPLTCKGRPDQLVPAFTLDSIA